MDASRLDTHPCARVQGGLRRGRAAHQRLTSECPDVPRSDAPEAKDRQS